MVRLVFILSSLLIIFTAFPFNTYAHEGHDHSTVEQATGESATASAEQAQVQYTLAYPGMLPDHPLHFLKVIRDRVVKFLISDPIKATEFNILTSDKRLFASTLLIEKEKYDLAIDTLSKSNNYLHEAVFSISNAQEEGVDINSALSNLETAVKKHQEVVSRQIEPHLPENMNERLIREIERLETIQNSVSEINPEE